MTGEGRAMDGPDALTGEQRARSAEADGEPLGAARRPARLALSNWPVSARLTALFALASVTGLVFGGLRVADAVTSSQAYGRTAQLAGLAQQDTVLAQALENERDLASGVAAYQTLSSDASADHASAAVTGPIATG